MKQYQSVYEKKCPTRTISWYKDHGSCVKMDVKVGNCTIDVEVPLSFAQVLIPFLNQGKTFKSNLHVLFRVDLCGWINVYADNGTEYDNETIGVVEREGSTLWIDCRSLDYCIRNDNGTFLHNTTCLIVYYLQTTHCTINYDQQDSDEEEETELSIEEQADGLEQYWLYTKNLVSSFNNKSNTYSCFSFSITAPRIHWLLQNWLVCTKCSAAQGSRRLPSRQFYYSCNERSNRIW
jgi:hypothetical protein